MHKRAVLFSLIAALSYYHPACSQETSPEAPAPDANTTYATVLAKITQQMQTDIVVESVKAQNTRYGDLSQQAIDALDTQWKEERKKAEQPLIAATLSNPLSSYLTRIQAHSSGLYVEIFVMDKNGLNVGQSNITSDYWQGDEGKWQKTFGAKSLQPFIDDKEYDPELKANRQQINVTIVDNATKQPIGAATVEINLDEYLRRGV